MCRHSVNTERVRDKNEKKSPPRGQKNKIGKRENHHKQPTGNKMSKLSTRDQIKPPSSTHEHFLLAVMSQPTQLFGTHRRFTIDSPNSCMSLEHLGSAMLSLQLHPQSMQRHKAPSKHTDMNEPSIGHYKSLHLNLTLSSQSRLQRTKFMTFKRLHSQRNYDRLHSLFQHWMST